MARFAKIVLVALALLLGLIALSILGLHFKDKQDGERLQERIQHWQGEISRGLPRGASVEDARQFFATRGIVLDCRTGPDEAVECWGQEAGSYGLLPTVQIHFRLVFATGAMTEWKVVSL